MRAQEEAPKFEAETEIVAVDASVVDGKGQPVRDLTAEEFVVKVDGRTRRVVSAEFVGFVTAPVAGTGTSTSTPNALAAEPAVQPASVAAARREGRRYVIVIDRGQLTVGSIKSATAAASRLLDQLGPEDRVAVFSLPSGPRLDFTPDRSAIEQTLDRIGPGQDRWMGEFNISVAEAIAFVERRDRNRLIMRECAQYLDTVRTSDEEACAIRVESETQQQIDQAQNSVEDRLGALEGLIQALGQVPGPKTLVLASGGFVAVSTGGTPRVGHRLRQVATAAAASRVNLYSLHFSQRSETYAASVSRHEKTVDDNQYARAQGLETLTGLAGGAMYEAVAGANFAFDRVVSETSGHYLLGLEPSKRDRDGKPHDIEVKVSRKGVEVRARRQFVLTAASVTARPRPTIVRAAQPPSPFRMATHVLRGDTAGQIKVVMAAQVDGFSDARFDIEVLDPTGARVGSLAEHATAEGAPVRHEETLILPRGLYTLKANAVDAAGRRAAFERPLNAELSHGVGFDISDLLILEKAGEKMRLSASGAIGSDTMAVYLEIYMQQELPTDRMGVSIEVVGADGARRSTTALPLHTDATKELLYAEGVVDLFTVPPGAYVARARVTFGTKTVRTVERAFEVRR